MSISPIGKSRGEISQIQRAEVPPPHAKAITKTDCKCKSTYPQNHNELKCPEK